MKNECFCRMEWLLLNILFESESFYNRESSLRLAAGREDTLQDVSLKLIPLKEE